MRLVVWVDEEVGGFSRVTRKLKARGIELTELLSAGEALHWHRGQAAQDEARHERAILVVDMMLAPGDDAREFSASNTHGYMLTGLELLKILGRDGALGRYSKIVIYTALKDPSHLATIRAWIDTHHSQEGGGTPCEIRPKSSFDHDEILNSVMRDLGLDDNCG